MTVNMSAMHGLVDVDIHEHADLVDLVPYLEPRWHPYIVEAGWKPDWHLPYTQLTAGGRDRADAKLADGRPGGSDYGLLREQLLDEYNITHGILTGSWNASALHPGWVEFKNALMSAYNDWQIERWLEKDERLFGSIQVNCHDPAGAVREIERLADHPKMIQVMLYIGPVDRAFGEPEYHPILAAAERHDLVVGIHHSQNSRTALGWHRYFVEWHTLVSQVFMSEAISLIFNGVFEKFPRLKVILVEGGFSFVPHLMWRADQNWRQMRLEVPWIKRKPSEIMREHIRFATQPIEEFTRKEFETLIDQMGSEELLCFATDYPHWDFDSPWEAFPPGISSDLLTKMLSTNASNIYSRLPAPAALSHGRRDLDEGLS